MKTRSLCVSLLLLAFVSVVALAQNAQGFPRIWNDAALADWGDADCGAEPAPGALARRILAE